MDKKMITAIAVIGVMVITGGAYVAMAMTGTESSVPTAGVMMYTDGTYVELEGAGDTVREVLEDALVRGGHTLEMLSNGNISAVDGSAAGPEEAWTLFQWLPKTGWKLITIGSAADASLESGTTYCINMSSVTTVEGKTTYSLPYEEPTAVCWFYIVFKADYDAVSVLGIYTESERRSGFWISGEGSNVAYAFKDACSKTGFDLNMQESGDLLGWLNSFLGLEDVKVPGSLWQYWSQFHWDGDSWEYNDFTMGYYDPGVNGYFALVRQTTEENNANAGIFVTPEDCPGWSS